MKKDPTGVKGCKLKKENTKMRQNVAIAPTNRRVVGATVSPDTPAVDSAKPVRIVAATEREARALTESVREKFKMLGSAWFDLGREVSNCLDRQVPHAYGLAAQGKSMNVAEWLELCFPQSVPKIYRALRIAKVLKALPEERVKLLTEGNAYNLTRLPEKLRTDEEWLDRAVELDNEEFSQAVDEVLEKKGHPKKEKWFEMFPRMPETFKELFEATEEKLAGVLGLDIALKPEMRNVIWQRVVALLFQTGDNVLREAFVGGDKDGEVAET